MKLLFVKPSSTTNSKINIILLNLIMISICNFFCNTKAILKLPPNETVPALLAFGDSILDTGNNNNLPTIVKCNFPPYGRDLNGHIPTGRFSNGKVPSDLIAEEFGIKELLPAYLSPNLQPHELITGVCFASGATGYDPITPKQASVISLFDQLEMFKQYIVKIKGIVGEGRTEFILAKSVFLVSSSSNDITNTYFSNDRKRMLQYSASSYADFMVDQATKFLRELYGLGARRIGVFGAPPDGCLPSQRTIAGGTLRKCSEKHNQVAMLFNSKLSAALDSLRMNLTDSRIVYIDIYRSLLDLIQNPKKYGFGRADIGCCGTGELEVSILCNPLTPTCPNVSDYVFWDSFHPTEQGYRVLVSQLRSYLNNFF